MGLLEGQCARRGVPEEPERTAGGREGQGAAGGRPGAGERLAQGGRAVQVGAEAGGRDRGQRLGQARRALEPAGPPLVPPCPPNGVNPGRRPPPFRTLAGPTAIRGRPARVAHVGGAQPRTAGDRRANGPPWRWMRAVGRRWGGGGRGGNGDGVAGRGIARCWGARTCRGGAAWGGGRALVTGFFQGPSGSPERLGSCGEPTSLPFTLGATFSRPERGVVEDVNAQSSTALPWVLLPVALGFIFYLLRNMLLALLWMSGLNKTSLNNIVARDVHF